METSTFDPEYWYSVKEIAFLWNMDDETIRRIFLKEAGVILRRNQEPGKRIYRMIRIPGSVVLRVQRRMTVLESQSTR